MTHVFFCFVKYHQPEPYTHTHTPMAVPRHINPGLTTLFTYPSRLHTLIYFYTISLVLNCILFFLSPKHIHTHTNNQPKIEYLFWPNKSFPSNINLFSFLLSVSWSCFHPGFNVHWIHQLDICYIYWLNEWMNEMKWMIESATLILNQTKSNARIYAVTNIEPYDFCWFRLSDHNNNNNNKDNNNKQALARTYVRHIYHCIYSILCIEIIGKNLYSNLLVERYFF